jgi:hypothetical protein
MVKLPDNSYNKPNIFERSNKTTVLDALNKLKRFSKRLLTKTEQYFNTEDIEMKLDCLDSVSSSYNNIIQNFMDLLDVIQIYKQEAPCTSLRSYIRYYESLGFSETIGEKEILYYFVSRNELIHDYMDYEYLADDTAKKVENYGDGILKIIDHLEEFFYNNNLLEKPIK